MAVLLQDYYSKFLKIRIYQKLLNCGKNSIHFSSLAEMY